MSTSPHRRVPVRSGRRFTPARGACAILALAATTVTAACADGASQPTALDTEALVAAAPAWQPTDLAQGLQVDAATRARIDAGMHTLHASLLELHPRYEAALAQDGDARAAAIAALETDMRALHEEHATLWNALEPDVREALAARIHAQMNAHGDGTMRSFHDRLRRLHGGAHDVSGAGH